MNSISPRESTLIVPRGIPAGTPLLDFLSGRFPHIGAETWKSRIAEGKVRFSDGTDASAFSGVVPGMGIRYYREVSAEPSIPDAHQVIYRDGHILVACKPHFLPVVPAGKYVRECLLYRLLEETGLRGLSPVHRIDRHTAGLVLFSIHESERGAYQDLFKDREVEKGYLANVRWLSSPPAGDSWELQGRIEKHGPTMLRHLAEGVPNSFCRMRLLERSGSHAGLALYPFTGKKHQLRLQVSQIGAAILHDPYYPDLLPEGPDDPARPLQLLSKSLRFRDPFTQRDQAFTSPRELLPLPPGLAVHLVHAGSPRNGKARKCGLPASPVTDTFPVTKKAVDRMLGKSIILATSLMISMGLAQTVRISGTITNFAGAPIANAQIALGTGGLTASSDAQGKFNLSSASGILAPTFGGIPGTTRDGFLKLRLENESRVTLSVFSTMGRKLSTESRTLGTGEHALPLHGKNGYFIYRLTADEKEIAFPRLAKAAAATAPYNNVLKVTAGGFIAHEAILFAAGAGIDTTGIKIVLLKEGDLPRFSFFVTSLAAMRALSGNEKGFGGDLRYGLTGAGSGLRGADKICSDVAERGLKGSAAKQWRAFLSVNDAGNGAKLDAIDRIGAGPWYDRLGRVLATNKAGLTSADRPAGDAVIASDLPNETGELNHAAGGVTMDNHDVLTGSDKAGRLNANPNCADWTTTTTPGGAKGPMAGHAWPANSGKNWMQAHGVAGCAASVVSGQGGFDGDGVGDGGGYGSFYCFALVP